MATNCRGGVIHKLELGFSPNRVPFSDVVSARVNLDRHVRKSWNMCHALLVYIGRLRPIRHDRRDQADMSRSEPPDMEVAYTIPLDLQMRSDVTRQARVPDRVEQDRARRAH